MITTLLYISGVAFAAFMGMICGVGLTQATHREQDALRDIDAKAERDSTAGLVEALMTSQGNVEVLIAQIEALSSHNVAILAMLQQAAQAAGAAAFASVSTTGRPN